MVAEFHAWALIMRDGEVLKGEDDFPPELAKLNAKAFILETPHLSLEVQVPAGHKLVFKRRNQVFLSESMEEKGRAHRYIVATEPISMESEAKADHAPAR